MARHPSGRPPLIVHCTDGQNLEPGYARVARSLSLLSTEVGSTRLVHCGWTADGEKMPDFLDDLSATLPDGRRAMTVNRWPIEMIWDLLFGEMKESSLELPPATNAFDVCQTFWTAKLGNDPKEWEDAFAVDASSGVAAICDGASEGIFCRLWADLLAQRAIEQINDVKNVNSLMRFVDGCRTAWKEAINYSQLRWSQQHRVDSVGAAATFLLLRVGALEESGERRWIALAVGDSCLFHIRNNRLLATCPIVSREQFGSTPRLVRSDPTYSTSPIFAYGQCRPGDLFFLATDAVASHLFHDPDGCVDWQRFLTLSDSDWQKEMDSLRLNGEMVNDDCTLLVLRVGAE